MADDKKMETGSELSPICRRAFLRKVRNVGFGALAVGAVAGTSSGCFFPANGGGSTPPASGNCGYCNGDGRDYSHCDGAYCNYINYADG